MIAETFMGAFLSLAASGVSCWNDFADHSSVELREAQPSVRQRRDAACAAVRRRDVVFADQRPVWCHAADLVGKILSEPEVAVAADSHTAQRGVRRRDDVFADGAIAIDTA